MLPRNEEPEDLQNHDGQEEVYGAKQANRLRAVVTQRLEAVVVGGRRAHIVFEREASLFNRFKNVVGDYSNETLEQLVQNVRILYVIKWHVDRELQRVDCSPEALQ